MYDDNLLYNIRAILFDYKKSFSRREDSKDTSEEDVLMKIFDITNEMKSQNKQYWGRELGMIWQKIIIETFKIAAPDIFKPTQRIGHDEPYDLQIENFAIDTKYRIGSGDAGTLKKFKQYGELLKNMGFVPMILLLRTDSLPAAITACKNGGWIVLEGDYSFHFIEDKTGINLKDILKKQKFSI